MTANGHLDAAIRVALDVPDWDESISRVKDTVAKALKRIDRTVRIENTGYFNHSFVPDFRLLWDSAEKERDVYLRLDTSSSFLANDLTYLKAEEPILFGLGISRTERTNGEVASEAARANTLVTDPDAVESFGEQPTSEFSSVVPAAVLRGGKGVIRELEATNLVSAGVNFFGGARSHEAEAITDSAVLIEEHLRKEEAGAVTNFGRIVWEATGGAPQDFPLSTALAGLDDDAIRFLMEEGPTEDLAYWRSIGNSVTLDRLIDLGVHRPKNLWSLLGANLDRMLARFLQVRPDDQILEDTPYWAVTHGALELRGDDFSALFAVRREDVSVELHRDPGSEGKPIHGISLRQLRERTSHLTVGSVSVATRDGKTVTVESDSRINVQDDETLMALASSTVEGVGLLIGGKHLECRFDQLTASGHTNAQFEVAELIEYALPLLWRLGNTDQAEIARLLTTWRKAKTGGKLFDEETL